MPDARVLPDSIAGRADAALPPVFVRSRTDGVWTPHDRIPTSP